MPAETHSCRDPLGIGSIIELLWTVHGGPGDPPDPGTSLRELGIDTDLQLLDLFEAAGEEFGERSLADVELDDLRELRTVGELAEAIVAWTAPVDGGERR